MLAVVDDLARTRMLVGRGATAEIRATLQKMHLVSGSGQCRGSGNAGDAPADDGNGFSSHALTPAPQARKQDSKQTARENHKFCKGRHGNTMRKDVVIPGRDTLQQAMIDRNQYPESGPCIGG